MFRQLTVFLLFLVCANAETSQQRWAYDAYLKELARLQQRFQLPENVSKEEPPINSLNHGDNSLSPTKSAQGIQKEHVFSEQKTPLAEYSGKELEKELDTKVQPLARIQLPDVDPPFGNFSDANDTEYSIFCDDELLKVHTHIPAVSKLMMALARESEHKLEEDVSTEMEPTSTTEVTSTKRACVERNKEEVFDKDSLKPEEIAVNQKEPSSNLLEQGPAITSNTSQDESSARRQMETMNNTVQSTEDDSTVKTLMETVNNTVQSMEDASTAKTPMETVNNTVQSMEDASTAKSLMETVNNTVQSTEDDSTAKTLMETVNNTVQSMEDASTAKTLMETVNNTVQSMEDDLTMKILMETMNNTVQSMEDDLTMKTLMEIVQSMEDDSTSKGLMETTNNTVLSMEDDSTAKTLMETMNNTVQSMEGDSTPKTLMETVNNTVQSTEDDSTARILTETTTNTVQSTEDYSTGRILTETTNSIVQSMTETAKGLMEIMNNTVQSMNEIQFEFQQDDEDQKVISRGDSSEDLELFNNTEELDFHCPTEFGFFPDPSGNCSVFYSCHDGKPEKRVCADGKLHFNPITRVCDHPAQALCELECPQVNGRFPVPGYCDMFLECNIGQGKIVSCPPELHFNAVTKLCDKPSKVACQVSCPSYNALIALPGRCNMYVSCENGEAIYNTCPTGLHFNPLMLKCDWPDKAGCDIQCPSSDGYFPVLGQCGTYLLCRDNYLKIETCPSGLHFNFLLRTCDVPSKAGCQLKCKKPNGFFPFPGVCSHYIKCLGGIPSLHKCPQGLEFNAATMQCDITQRDHCRPRCPTEKGFFPVPNHCDLYVRCSDRQPIVKRCPSNLHFNALFKECDTPERAKCEPVCSSPSGLFPLPGKCNMFFRCDNYTASVQSCAHGLHFNARTLTCDWPASVHCEMGCPELDGFYPIQGECNAYIMCTNGHPVLKTCSHDKHFNFETSRCDTPKNAKCNPTCPSGNGKFPLPGHCDSYVHCQDGKPYQDSCPPGLLFSKDKKMCDLSENVICHSGLY